MNNTTDGSAIASTRKKVAIASSIEPSLTRITNHSKYTVPDAWPYSAIVSPVSGAATHTGSVRSQYFAMGPRPSDSGAIEACTVVDWSNWGKVGTSGLSMQAVLYHQSWEIALQYTALDPSAGASATVGVQDPAQEWGVAARCGGTNPIPAPGAICLFDPRFPPGSLGIEDLLFADGFEDTTPSTTLLHR